MKKILEYKVFDLFDEKAPFYQCLTAITEKNKIPHTKLSFEKAATSSCVFADHSCIGSCTTANNYNSFYSAHFFFGHI